MTDEERKPAAPGLSIALVSRSSTTSTYVPNYCTITRYNRYKQGPPELQVTQTASGGTGYGTCAGATPRLEPMSREAFGAPSRRSVSATQMIGITQASLYVFGFNAPRDGRICTGKIPWFVSIYLVFLVGFINTFYPHVNHPLS